MDDKLERILQEGIANYASSEPLAGLEERILARIRRTERPRRRNMGWRGASAVAAVGIALAAAVVFLTPRHEEQRAALIVTNVPPQRISSEARVPISTLRRHRRNRVRPLPKLPVFPTPSRLTAEERRLLVMVRQDPEGTVAAFESLRKLKEPIEIAPLTIEPLETGGGQ